MADDFKTQAAQQRLKVLAAAKARVAANISTYEANGDVDSAADELQAYSNLESEEQNLINSYNRYVASNTPRAARPMTDAEFTAMSPEQMMERPDAVDKIFSTSKYYTKDQWSDPKVVERMTAGVAEVQRRRREEGR